MTVAGQWSMPFVVLDSCCLLASGGSCCSWWLLMFLQALQSSVDLHNNKRQYEVSHHCLLVPDSHANRINLLAVYILCTLLYSILLSISLCVAYSKSLPFFPVKVYETVLCSYLWSEFGGVSMDFFCNCHTIIAYWGTLNQQNHW